MRIEIFVYFASFSGWSLATSSSGNTSCVVSGALRPLSGAPESLTQYKGLALIPRAVVACEEL